MHIIAACTLQSAPTAGLTSPQENEVTLRNLMKSASRALEERTSKREEPDISQVNLVRKSDLLFFLSCNPLLGRWDL